MTERNLYKVLICFDDCKEEIPDIVFSEFRRLGVI